VTFADISDPASVELVDPENLAASFGPGVRLKSVVLEVTDEGVTEGVVEEFPFWPTLKEQITFSGLHFADPKRPDPLNYETYTLLKQESTK
ncbi:MAG: hypothetical protein ACRC14_14875, partial [Paracoccaceae bacterium]